MTTVEGNVSKVEECIMAQKQMVTIDGNQAASNVAYAFSEVAAIYPITPSSPMGEMADEWSARDRVNLFGEKVDVVEMQSEGGAAGACHGVLSAGGLVTTFTASQGLLLMIPNMYKIAGELMPTVFHVTARSLACQSLSIFGDHSDVMSARSTGFAMLASASVQEAQDLAAVAHLATLESRIPFVHFFDGFRTSHCVKKIQDLPYETLREMLDMKFIQRHRDDAMNPERPFLKVAAQNPDVYFQGRETVNTFYEACPGIVRKYMKLFAEKTGRVYDLFQYVGDPEAELVIIAMASACETIEETVNHLTSELGMKVGAVKVRLYRPWSGEDLLAAIPPSATKIAVLDRTKEPGAPGEPLYLDVVSTFKGRSDVDIIGGRYGLSSKEFTPSMVKAVYDHLAADGFHDFTVGITDDVTHKSLTVEEALDTELDGVIRCKFWGYGSDGTVSANKNSIKIIGEGTDQYVQAYFDYDSNKSGGYTVSHLRFGQQPIQSEYLLSHSDFIALHRHQYIGRYDILGGIVEGGTFLINIPDAPEEVFSKFTEQMQKTIRQKKVKVYCIDAETIAKEVGLPGRINTVMQTAFFKLSGVLPEAEAIQMIKDAVKKQFERKGKEIVEMNWKAIDAASDAVKVVPIPGGEVGSAAIQDVVPAGSDEFAMKVIDPVLRLKGDDVPVSLMPVNGALPTGTKRLERKGNAGAPMKKVADVTILPDVQVEEPYWEWPGSCQGCGEVPYIHIATQMFGDRMLIANATGCSSIYGGTFPTTPYTKDSNGRGPAWANSLFEDNAEYGFGMRLAVDSNRKLLRSCVERAVKANVTPELTEALGTQLKLWDQVTREAKQNAEVVKAALQAALAAAKGEAKANLQIVSSLADWLVDKSVWIFGGDGWAYDIGYGGLDHVMASDKNVNVLVLDTEVYSNTGGQASKSTPRGAVAKFAAGGKKLGKKNLGLMMTTYGSAFVGSINLGANRDHALQTIAEAEQYKGPSIVIAYSPCIAHGYKMALGMKQAKLAEATGYWPLYTFNPSKEQPFSWDTAETTEDFREFVKNEVRYKTLQLSMPDEAERLFELAKQDNQRRFEDLKHLAAENK